MVMEMYAYSSSVFTLTIPIGFLLFLVSSAESSFVNQLRQLLLDEFVDFLNSSF